MKFTDSVCVRCIWFWILFLNSNVLAMENGENKLVYNNTKENYDIKNISEFKEMGNNTNPSITIQQSEINFPKKIKIVMEIFKKLQNEDCVKDLQVLVKGVKENAQWALQIFDSFPKVPLGMLFGNFYQLGNFDECVFVNHLTEEERRIQGQYCLSDITFELRKNGHGFLPSMDDNLRKTRHDFNTSLIHWGICLPHTCSPKDGEVIMKELFFSFIRSFVVNVTISEKNCYYEKHEVTSTGEIIYACIISFFLLFILFATISHMFHVRKRKKRIAYSIDTVRNQDTSTKNEIIFSFSLIQSIGKVLHTKPNELNLECICGIKFLSMMLIINGHALIFIMGSPVANKDFFQETSLEVQNGMFLNNPLLVDTFLLVSGFLMCRLLLIELQKRRGKINVLVLYIARYVRLTPAYLVIIGFYLTWLPKMGTGPLWNITVETEKERCQESWWGNILYINNYIKTESLCMFQAWYLAADYHLFILAPLIIYPLWKWKKIGLASLVIFTISSVILPFYITLKEKLDPTLLAFPPEVEDLSTNFYFVTAYIKTHMRATSYFLGLVFGYTVHKIQANGTKIPASIIWIGWTLSALFGTISMFSIVIFFDPNYQYNATESAIYAALHRMAWCLAIGWVIFACVTENAAMVNKFLSWKFFVPLSRLTYCAYLLNGIIEIYHKGVTRDVLFLSKFELACRLLGHAVLTFFFAFLLCICFESPIHALEKILLKKQPLVESVRTPTTVMRVIEESDNSS